ncbi:MAG: hypothetical protein ACRD6N_15260 [Pyrinomonadaceae bacterium]
MVAATAALWTYGIETTHSWPTNAQRGGVPHHDLPDMSDDKPHYWYKIPKEERETKAVLTVLEGPQQQERPPACPVEFHADGFPLAD